MRCFTLFLLINFITGILVSSELNAQYHKSYKPLEAGEIKSNLKKADNLGTVLYLAAHPDDENTELIAYLANEMNLRTAYLSLTRGDGGQNLIGSEKGKFMGVLRTQELLGARSVDNGLQFFTRANDFGYSKTTEETLNMWGEERVLSDVVWVIRNLKPDIIINRFPEAGYENAHGHHTASATLAKQAVKAAGDENRFTDQLAHVDPWQPKRVLFNTSYFFYRGSEKSMDSSGLVSENVGKFNPLLGHSYVEMGALSSSHHKSQGFGDAPERGGKLEFMKHVLGDKNNNGIMAGIDTDWTRLQNGQKVGKHLDKALQQFDAEAPQKIIPHLVNAYKALDKLESDHWKGVKKAQIKRLILAANGCWFDATAPRDYGVPGSDVTIKSELLQRNGYEMSVQQIKYPFGKSKPVNKSLSRYEPLEQQKEVTIPKGANFTHPYWLRQPKLSEGMYQVKNQSSIGLPETPTPMKVTYTLSVDGIKFHVPKPVRYRWEDRVEGERYNAFEIGPPATISPQGKAKIFPNQLPKTIELKVKARKNQVNGMVGIELPEGWQSEPKTRSVTINGKGEIKKLRFKIIPPEKRSGGEMKAYFKNDNSKTSRDIVTIQYDHIPTQRLFPKAKLKLLRENVDKKGDNIGYIMGTGDDVPTALRQMNYDITMLNDDNFDDHTLADFDAIVIGVRAYNTKEWLNFKRDALMNYVKGGGTMVVQYNKDRNLVTKDIGPYPFKIAYDRVTVEKAPVKFLKPDHPILNEPNNITKADFQGWVQERGLYFPGEWDENYTPLLSSHDPGEEPKKGGMIFTEYGEGAFIYTGYAFFRQLPAGIPGAYKLFTNLVSYGN